MGPVAGNAKKGEPKAKYLKKIQNRIASWAKPESKQFADQISRGGAKCPGSHKFYS